MALRKLTRLFHTVRYLKLTQVLYRLFYRFSQVRLCKKQPAVVRRWAHGWPAVRWGKLSTSDAVDFTFLGTTGRVQLPEDWQAGRHAKLWLYNLHYLDDLNANGIDERPDLALKLVRSWIGANPPVAGEGWEPYPLSLRTVNLVKWFAQGETPADDYLYSLADQGDALSQQVEYHILGNHLFANAKALIFIGAYLDGPQADRWLAKGLRLIDRQISEQFLEDGGHFELSPMYHAILLWDMCDLVNLGQCSQLPTVSLRLPQWLAVIERGLKWLSSMLHPDGRIAFFNDAAFGIAPDFEHLLAYATRLGARSPTIPSNGVIFNSDTGYIAVVPIEGVKAILDVAAVGPDYQPGHAHADTLSFELSVFGRRLIVNSGTSQYGEGPERQRQRSTSAHSTVEVAGQDSSEVWAGFRVARRARSVVENIDMGLSPICIQAAHDGYLRLEGRHIHRRKWMFFNDELVITDELTGGRAPSIARFYIHPDVYITQEAEHCVADLGANGRVMFDFTGAEQVRVVASTWHPEFGCAFANQCIEVAFSSGSLKTRIRWG